jgi:hypothetical protein
MALANFESIPGRLLRGEITRRWQELTPSDIEECCTDGSKLVDVLQARYGFAKNRAVKEVELFLGEFHGRLRLAA